MSTDPQNPYETSAQIASGQDFSNAPRKMLSRKMHIRKITPLSAGKILGALYAVLGLIAGAIFMIASVVGVAAGGQNAVGGLVMSGLGILLMPLLYGGMGFLGGVVAAFLYNVGASMVGGIELEIET